MQTHPIIFDGHNDALLKLRGRISEFLTGTEDTHLDLPRARAAGMGGGFFAIFVPHDPEGPEPAEFEPELTFASDYEVPRPEPLTREYALRSVIEMAESLFQIEKESAGTLRVVRTTQELRACLDDGTFATILHLEGAEAIGPDLEGLNLLYRAGMRSLGPVWSRTNVFAQGVPFAFPRSPDTGPGLTEAGHRLVKACNELGILIDCSHITEKGFWDIAKTTTAPLVATHSCAHALSPCARNLTDKQLDAIAESNGLVGINYHVSFLRPDGRIDEDTPLDLIAKHARYIADRIGPQHVALGSDYDGATIPKELNGVDGLPKLMDALAATGFDEPSLRLIAHENWLRILDATWS